MSRPAEPYPIAPSRVSDRADDDVLAARGVAGEDDREDAGEADHEAERAQGGDALVRGRACRSRATKNGRGVEQDRRDRRPGAARALGEPGERERRAAEAHQRRRTPTGAACAAGASRTARRNGSSTRKPNAPRENAVKAGVVWSQRDLGDVERRAPEEHRDEQQQRNGSACAETSHRRRETTLSGLKV